MKPGTMVMPPASKISVPLPARPRISSVLPTATNLPSRTAKASARGRAASIVWTVALVTIRSGVSAAQALVQQEAPRRPPPATVRNLLRLCSFDIPSPARIQRSIGMLIPGVVNTGTPRAAKRARPEPRPSRIQINRRTLVRAGAAEAEIVLGGHDRDRVACHHVEQRHDHHEEEGRRRETLEGDEFDQRHDEGQHRKRMVDDLARGGSRRLDDLDEEQRQRYQQKEIGQREHPLVAGDERDIDAMVLQEGLEIVVADGPTAEGEEVVDDDNDQDQRKQAQHMVLPVVPPVTVSPLYHNWAKLRRR